MDEKAIQFVIAIFDSEAGAEETLSSLKSEKREKLNGVQAAVVMRKDAENQIHYKDVGMTPAKGALAGTALGAIIGIATGGASLVLGAAGALLGGLVGKRKREGNVAAEKVNQVVASIPTESSALLAIVETDATDQFEESLQGNAAQTFTAQILADLASALNEHSDGLHAAYLENLEQ
jgi:uncharacterized membrane protein